MRSFPSDVAEDLGSSVAVAGQQIAQRCARSLYAPTNKTRQRRERWGCRIVQQQFKRKPRSVDETRQGCDSRLLPPALVCTNRALWDSNAHAQLVLAQPRLAPCSMQHFGWYRIVRTYLIRYMVLGAFW